MKHNPKSSCIFEIYKAQGSGTSAPKLVRIDSSTKDPY